jgi:hypothetical protein
VPFAALVVRGASVAFSVFLVRVLDLAIVAVIWCDVSCRWKFWARPLSQLSLRTFCRRHSFSAAPKSNAGLPEPIVASQHLQAHDRLVFILALSPADGYQFQLSSPCSQPFHEQRVNDNQGHVGFDCLWPSRATVARCIHSLVDWTTKNWQLSALCRTPTQSKTGSCYRLIEAIPDTVEPKRRHRALAWPSFTTRLYRCRASVGPTAPLRLRTCLFSR